MLIKKVKINKNESVQLEFKQLIKNDAEEGEKWNTIKITSEDRPSIAFYEALNKLVPHVAEICEFTTNENNLKVKGVEFTYTGTDDIMGARILAEKILHNSDVNLQLKTPHKISEPYNDTDTQDKLFSEEAVQALQKILEETEEYIKGERDQLKLDLG